MSESNCSGSLSERQHSPGCLPMRHLSCSVLSGHLGTSAQRGCLFARAKSCEQVSLAIPTREGGHDARMIDNDFFRFSPWRPPVRLPALSVEA